MEKPMKELRFGSGRAGGYIFAGVLLTLGGMILAAGMADPKMGSGGRIACYIIGPALLVLGSFIVFKTLKDPGKKDFLSIQLFEGYFMLPVYKTRPYSHRKIALSDISEITRVIQKETKSMTGIKLKLRSTGELISMSYIEFENKNKFNEFAKYLGAL